MERLIHLISARNPQKLYIVWSERNRISIVDNIKQNNKTHYQFTHCDWFLTYTLKEELRDPLPNVIQKTNKSNKYVVFDGHELLDFDQAGYNRASIMNRLATPFFKKQENTRADDLELLSMSSEMKYLKSIVNSINDPKYMTKWIENDQARYKMMYMTLLFLACMSINPSFIPSLRKPTEGKSSGFMMKTKQDIIDSWKKVHESKTEQLWIDGKARDVEMVQDCVGLWCISHALKKELGKATNDTISSFDIEHVVSNSFDIPSSEQIDWSQGWNQPWNGVLLDSTINRRKGNTMLFLVGNNLAFYIRKKQELQMQWLRKNRVKWYQSIWKW